jgi:hypothetical protein
MSEAKVRYILTEHDTLVVNGVVASVYSTAAQSWETLPFHVFDSIFAGGVADKMKKIKRKNIEDIMSVNRCYFLTNPSSRCKCLYICADLSCPTYARRCTGSVKQTHGLSLSLSLLSLLS